MNEQPLELRAPTEAELDADLRRFGYNPKHIHKDAKLAVVSGCIVEKEQTERIRELEAQLAAVRPERGERLTSSQSEIGT